MLHNTPPATCEQSENTEAGVGWQARRGRDYESAASERTIARQLQSSLGARPPEFECTRALALRR